jgi:antitoxin PrlF
MELAVYILRDTWGWLMDAAAERARSVLLVKNHSAAGPASAMHAHLTWQCDRITIRDITEPQMSATLEAESSLTDRYQTTVPEPVRRALRLRKRDKVHYTIRDGEVVLSRAEAPDTPDPVLGEFLGFLARDMKRHPERLQAVDPTFAKRVRALVRHVEVDLDAPLSPEDE